MTKKSRLYLRFLKLFLLLKLIIYSIAHIAVLTIEPNDTSGELIVFASENRNIFDRFLKKLVLPMIRWDAVHMLAIAKHGYVAELQFAFFPLLPMVSRFSALFLYKFFGFSRFVSIEPLMALLALIFTNSCHFAATISLYNLTKLLFKSSKFAKTSALLFMFNAASVQLSSMYTEAPFAFFTLAGLNAFYSGNHFIASVFWFLAALNRSNGIVLVGFFAYDLLTTIFAGPCLFYIFKKTILTIIYSLISISGFLAFQAYGYSQFCMIENPSRPWCQWTIPNIYSFVQNEYWNVGFLNYFTFKQIPNFMVAMPMIFICSLAVYLYFDHDHLRFLSLGLYKSRKPKSKTRKLPFFNDQILPHIYLLVFMLFTNVFIAHVQIITRVFTFMPVVYWFMAHIMMNFGTKSREALLTFIGLYGLIVTTLFSLNYPPA